MELDFASFKRMSKILTVGLERNEQL